MFAGETHEKGLVNLVLSIIHQADDDGLRLAADGKRQRSSLGGIVRGGIGRSIFGRVVDGNRLLTCSRQLNLKRDRPIRFAHCRIADRDPGTVIVQNRDRGRRFGRQQFSLLHLGKGHTQRLVNLILRIRQNGNTHLQQSCPR